MDDGRRLDLKVGFACNNHCLFCAQGDKRQRIEALPVARLLSELAAQRGVARGLVLTGGEPTVYKPLVRLVRAARQLGYAPIQLQTNARLLSYPQVLRTLVDAGVNEVAPSLHGATAEVHEALTRAEGSFDQSVAGIRSSVAAGLPVVTNTVVVCQNLDTLSEIVRLLASLGVRRAQLAFVHPVGTALELFDDVVPRLPDVVEPIRAAREVALAAGVTLVTEAVPLCFLPGMQELAVEAQIPPTTVADIDGHLDYSSWRVAEGKAHGPPCVACTARDRCEGPWREYPDRRGWDEFRAL